MFHIIKNKNLKLLAVNICILLYIVTVVIRAVVVPITMDESFTYLAYVRDTLLEPSKALQVFLHSKGNNHLLNTALMIIIEAIAQHPFEEIVVRLPSVLAGCGFAVLAGVLYLRQRIGLCAFLLLLGNNYLMEYFGLARGYGMSAFFVLAALLYVQDFFQKDSKMSHYRSFALASALLILAQSANTIVLLLTFSTYLLMLLWTIRRKEIQYFLTGKRLLGVLLIGLCHLILALYHLLISLTDALYSAKTDPFRAIALGYASQYIHGETGRWIAAIAFVLLLIGAPILLRRRLKELPIVLLIYIHILVSILLGALTGKGYPMGRVLLPSVPLLALAAEELLRRYLSYLPERFARNIQCIAIPVSLLILALAAHRDVLHGATRDWDYTAGDKMYVYGLMLRQEAIDPEIAPYDGGIRFGFYRNKLMYEYGFDAWSGERVE